MGCGSSHEAGGTLITEADIKKNSKQDVHGENYFFIDSSKYYRGQRRIHFENIRFTKIKCSAISVFNKLYS
jgi:hypothetical protein